MYNFIYMFSYQIKNIIHHNWAKNIFMGILRFMRIFAFLSSVFYSMSKNWNKIRMDANSYSEQKVNKKTCSWTEGMRHAVHERTEQKQTCRSFWIFPVYHRGVTWTRRSRKWTNRNEQDFVSSESVSLIYTINCDTVSVWKFFTSICCTTDPQLKKHHQTG